MAQTKLSKIAWTFEGDYTTGRTYLQLSVVSYGGCAYLSKTDGVTALPTNAAYWVKITKDFEWSSMSDSEKASVIDEVARGVNVDGVSFKEALDAAKESAEHAKNVDDNLQELIDSGNIPEATIAQVVKNTSELSQLASKLADFAIDVTTGILTYGGKKFQLIAIQDNTSAIVGNALCGFAICGRN